MFIVPSLQSFNVTNTLPLLANGLNKTDTNTISMYTYGEPRLTIDRIGNIGIGITGISDIAPLSHKLDIANGNVRIADNLEVGGNFTISGGMNLTGDFSVDTDVLYVDTTNNRIGINSTTPSKALDVIGNALIQGGEICLIDTDEKIVSTGTVMHFDVGGSERVRIDGSGSVGIGTDNSLTRLHVAGTIRGENFGSGDQVLQLQSGRGNRWDIIAGTDVDGGSNPLRIVNNGTNYMHILEATGNIGIGISIPTEKLHVGGNARIDGDLIIHGQTTLINSLSVAVEDNMIRLADNNPGDSIDIGAYGMYVDTGVTKFTGIYRDASESKWHIFDGDTTEPAITHTTLNSYFTVDTGVTGGRIGIGTQNPDYKLDIIGSGAMRLPVGNTSQRPTAVDGLLRYNSQQSTFEGYSNGNWGPIGGGASDLDGDTYIQAETSVGADNDYLQFFTAGTERMRIESDGDILATGSISSFATISDARLKENVVNLGGNLNKILELRPVSFNWKSENPVPDERRGKPDTGFLAQEIEKYIPDVVGKTRLIGGNGQKYKKIDYAKIVTYLVGAVQDQQKMIQENLRLIKEQQEIINKLTQ